MAAATFHAGPPVFVPCPPLFRQIHRFCGGGGNSGGLAGHEILAKRPESNIEKICNYLFFNVFIGLQRQYSSPLIRTWHGHCSYRGKENIRENGGIGETL